ncbi:DUF899 domain-containing protein [Herpetosiphon giganteus]|uniref:DUF899 domain-containing protein n=1 Tax=Herpetosiphon giganteus TaxID=2029754 RepID=UPI00195C3324|nr:DUF899 domain-containing protein [Herpetosiphon giganteus]MBM7844352.1 putative dithiol-disulfide oxidoreductase (DUF899 family) [Herpetosiphon giganteus]
MTKGIPQSIAFVSNEASTTPTIVDRQHFQANIDTLRVREKALTREADAIAAARRQLPMVEVDALTPLVGLKGMVPLIEAFEGRQQLMVAYMMWHEGKSAAEQCQGCTMVINHIPELGYLHSRDVTLAVFCQGPFDPSNRYREFMGWTMPWYSVPSSSVEPLIAGRHFGMWACYLRQGERVFETYWTTDRGCEQMGSSFAMLDLTVYGRQEVWQTAPNGWPQQFFNTMCLPNEHPLVERPIAQWSRIAQGHADDLYASTNANPTE